MTERYTYFIKFKIQILFSMKEKITLITFLLLTTIFNAQKIDPKHVINLCSNQDIKGTTPTTNIYNNLRTPCSNQPLSNSITFYYVEIESGSTFTFTISPNSPVDFDFASWKNPNFINLGIADRGSQNTIVGINTSDIGLSLNEPIELCEGAGVAPPFTGVIPGMVRYYDVQPGDGILIALDHWESSVIGYQLSFGGDAVLNCSIIDTTFEVCDYDHDGIENFDLDAIKNKISISSNNNFIVDLFENENDANNVNAINILPPSLNVYSSESPKTIYARFKRNNGLLAKVVPFELIINEVPILPEEDLVIEECDFDQNNTESFNLTKIENLINSLNSSQIIYKYYENKTDAEKNSDNNIQSPNNYLSKSKIIFVNISINNKCNLIIPLNLKVIEVFTSKSIEYSEFCAEENIDGLTYNLEKTYPYFIDDKSVDGYKFLLYKSMIEAENDFNPINNPEKHFVPYNYSETLFLKITNKYNCHIISQIILNSKKRVKSEDQYNNVCEPYILPPLPKGYQYRTHANGQGEILDPFEPTGIIYGKRTIYIHGNMQLTNAQTPEFNRCIYDFPFTVYNNDCPIPRGISPNGDGLNDNWDLTPFGVLELKIFNRYGKLVYQHGKDYTNQWNGKSNNGQMLPSGTYMFSFESINGTKAGWVELIREIK